MDQRDHCIDAGGFRAMHRENVRLALERNLLRAVPYYHAGNETVNTLIGCDSGRIPTRHTMHHTGDRCCVANGLNIIFEGTEAECHKFAEEHLKRQGAARLSIYAPLAVVTSVVINEFKVETRTVMKVRR